MSKQDWFRRTTWTEADKREFEEKYKRVRTPHNKAQYLRIQASFLQDSEDTSLVEAALELLTLYVQQFPDNLQMPWTLEQIAQCYEKLGRVDDAILAYQHAIEANKARRTFISNAEIMFARFVVAHDFITLFPQAEVHLLNVLSLSTSTKNHLFYHQGCLAIFAAQRGDLEDAKIFAQKSLEAALSEHSGFNRHKDFGLVEDRESVFFQRVKALTI